VGEDHDNLARARVGSILDGKWTLERLLGVGGMAAVYEARHRNGARAGVKILHRDLSRNADVRERFRREGYAANLVEHPGAVKVLDDDVVADGLDKGTAYLVMELLEGEALQDRLERAPPATELEFLRIAHGVLDVLEAAHARGVVHRDLKPENLFLARSEAGASATIKVLDFGLARLLQGQSITTYGLALGTPSFMSPEQAAGRIDEIDGRTDLFALAATGFCMRSGRRIHEADDAVDLVLKMAKLPAPRLGTVCSDVSGPFARVIDRALEFRREDRYESAAAMRNDVRLAMEQLEVGASPRGCASPAPPPPRKPPPPRDETTIELTGSDIETMASTDEESIRIPRRRSMVPWVTLLIFIGIFTKFGLDARASHRWTLPFSPLPSASTVDLDGGAAILRDAGGERLGAIGVATDSSNGAVAPHAAPASKALVSTAPTTSASHRPAPRIAPSGLQKPLAKHPAAIHQ
jgi:serine/threonine-protein kinase